VGSGSIYSTDVCSDKGEWKRYPYSDEDSLVRFIPPNLHLQPLLFFIPFPFTWIVAHYNRCLHSLSSDTRCSQNIHIHMQAIGIAMVFFQFACASDATTCQTSSCAVPRRSPDTEPGPPMIHPPGRPAEWEAG
jgi:hypothetical protein